VGASQLTQSEDVLLLVDVPPGATAALDLTGCARSTGTAAPLARIMMDLTWKVTVDEADFNSAGHILSTGIAAYSLSLYHDALNFLTQ